MPTSTKFRSDLPRIGKPAPIYYKVPNNEYARDKTCCPGCNARTKGPQRRRASAGTPLRAHNARYLFCRTCRALIG